MKKTLLLATAFSLLFHSMLQARDTVPEIGAQVFIEPGQMEEDVRSWFASMKEAGMKVCRIRIHEDHINRGGKWDFSIYDYAFDQAGENGIRVFATLFPNDGKKSVGGEKFPESEKHFKEVATYIDKTVAHFKDHPALSTWVIQNEPGVGGVLPENDFTRTRYDAWLKDNPQQDVSGFITNDYSSDKFLVYYETWYLQWISDRIRKADNKHDLHVNNHQIFCNVAEYDFPAWRHFLTSLGASAHPSWHFGYFRRDQYAMAMAANCSIIRSGAGNLPFWVTELQAGNNIYSGNVPICPTPAEITQWLWTSVSNGAEGIIFWTLNPRSATGEPGEWALLSLDNKGSERYEAAKDFITTCSTHAGLFAAKEDYVPPVTILYNRESLWAEKKMNFDFVRQDEGRAIGAVMKETLGLYQAFCENGIVPAFSEIREFDWDKSDYSGQMLVIANQIALPDEYVSEIKDFVSRGGKLIVTGLTGFWGSSNICKARTGFLFTDLFGGSFKEVNYVADDFCISMTGPSLILHSHMWESRISLTTGTAAATRGDEVLAARNKFGKGEVLWIPSLVGLGMRRTGNTRLATLVMLETAGLDIPVRFSSVYGNILMNTMASADGFTTVIINKNTEPQLLPLRVRDGYSPEIIVATQGGTILKGNIVNIMPEETVVINWQEKSKR